MSVKFNFKPLAASSGLGLAACVGELDALQFCGNGFPHRKWNGNSEFMCCFPLKYLHVSICLAGPTLRRAVYTLWCCSCFRMEAREKKRHVILYTRFHVRTLYWLKYVPIKMHKTVILSPQMGGLWWQVKNTYIAETWSDRKSENVGRRSFMCATNIIRVTIRELRRGAEEFLALSISYFPICNTKEFFLDGLVKEVRTTKS
jgi:hypothetical protein